MFFKYIGKQKNNKLINLKADKVVMALAYIICKNRVEAERISMHLLKKRLIACANIFPVKSMYWWKGRIAKENEVVLLAKTSKNKFGKLENEAKKIHSYEIPCIMLIDAKANKEYEKWVNKELGKDK